MMRPARNIATRSHTASTSLRMCDDNNTVCPRSRASPTHARNTCSMSGSSPVVGSSKSSRSARLANAAISKIFCRLPWLYARAPSCRVQGGSVRSARSRYASSTEPWILAQEVECLGAGQRRPEVGFARDVSDAAMNRRRVAPRVEPEDLARRPDVGRINPSSSPIVVDFPAPFGPRYPNTSPASISEVESRRARSCARTASSAARCGSSRLTKPRTRARLRAVARSAARYASSAARTVTSASATDQLRPFVFELLPPAPTVVELRLAFVGEQDDAGAAVARMRRAPARAPTVRAARPLPTLTAS